MPCYFALEVGKKSRMNRIFQEDGKTLIIPMERSNAKRTWTEIAKEVIKGKPDAIMTTAVMLKQYYNCVAGKIPIILTVPLELSYIDFALKTACVAVKWHYFGPIEHIPVQGVRKMASKCDECGMPFYLELVPMTAPWSKNGKPIIDADVLIKACQLATSLGADFIKTSYNNDPKIFSRVTSSCSVPVTILGGKRISDEECLKRIRGAMDAGAAGGAFGRNVTTHNTPKKMVIALRKIIHDDASIKEAKKELK